MLLQFVSKAILLGRLEDLVYGIFAGVFKENSDAFFSKKQGHPSAHAPTADHRQLGNPIISSFGPLRWFGFKILYLLDFRHFV